VADEALTVQGAIEPTAYSALSHKDRDGPIHDKSAESPEISSCHSNRTK
jgi:hypothetical protein